jgi:hypothetical protein
VDPYFVELWKRDQDIEPKLSKPKTSYHLWTGTLSKRISPGSHLVRVQTTDRHGRTYEAHRSIRVTGTPVPKSKNNEVPAVNVVR